jgi:hypothetical protein
MANCDMNRYRESSRISKSDKADWNLQIYIDWLLGVSTYQQTIEIFEPT